MNTTLNAENTSKSVIIAGLKINYHDAGEGDQTVIMLHGGGPGASGWGNYKDNIPTFSTQFRTLLIDMPHFGQSDKPADRYLDCKWYAEILTEAMDALGVTKSHFIGNSLGGTIALELAVAHPEKVDRLVLMGTAGSLALFGPLPSEGQKHLLGYYEGEGPTRQKLEAFIRSMIFDQSRVTSEFIDERYQASIAPELMVKRQTNLDGMFNVWRKVDQVPHKTLLVYGRDDRVVTWDTGLFLLRAMPRADLHVFSRSGHWTQWERAAEFNNVVAGFLLGPDT